MLYLHRLSFCLSALPINVKNEDVNLERFWFYFQAETIFFLALTCSFLTHLSQRSKN